MDDTLEHNARLMEAIIFIHPVPLTNFVSFYFLKHVFSALYNSLSFLTIIWIHNLNP